MIDKIKMELENISEPAKAIQNAYFFKTGPGDYAEGDKFIGVYIADLRRLAKKYSNIRFSIIRQLMMSRIHEHKSLGLIILVYKYPSCPDEVVKFYLNNISLINNWDFVDMSAPQILGNYLLNRNKEVLYTLARSINIWERRIAIVTTWKFINNYEFGDTISISEILLQDKEDLIHKAVGWMLREVGKKDLKLLEQFLDKNMKKMPRTMLRYSIEKFDDKRKKYYMRSK